MNPSPSLQAELGPDSVPRWRESVTVNPSQAGPSAVTPGPHGSGSSTRKLFNDCGMNPSHSLATADASWRDSESSRRAPRRGRPKFRIAESPGAGQWGLPLFGRIGDEGLTLLVNLEWDVPSRGICRGFSAFTQFLSQTVNGVPH